jgi:hypothetical protein
MGRILVGANIGEKIVLPPRSTLPASYHRGIIQLTKKYKAGGFYWERELYQSEAFLSLNKNAVKLLIALLDSRQREKPSEAKTKKGNKRKPKFVNLDCLEVPYGTLEKVYKIPERRISGAIDELLAKGFVRITYHGGAIKHDKSKYALVDDYLLWHPGRIPFATRPKRERRGYQGRNLRKKKPQAEVIEISNLKQS